MPLITSAVGRLLYDFIKSEAYDVGCVVLALNGSADHVHLLAQVPNTITIASLVKQIKGASSHLMNHRQIGSEFFKWQGGYGAFSVGQQEIPRVSSYISRQKEHHAAGSVLPDRS